MSSLDEVLTAIATSIQSKLDLLNRLESNLTKMQKSRLKQIIHTELRLCTGLIYDDPETEIFQKPMVSQAAHERAQSINSKLDLRNQTWRTQRKFDPDRTIFQWEHMSPISELKRLCTNRSIPEIISILKEKLRVAWILKSEDEKLTQLGYRSDRPDSSLAYREAGIILRSN